MGSLIFYLIFIALLIGALVALTRSGTGKRKFGDGYFYFMAFIALMVLYWGAADLLRIILEKWWLGGITGSSRGYYYGQSPTYANEQWLRGISLRISAVLVSLPIWFFHWHKAINKAKEEVDEVGKRAYSFAVVLIMGLSSIGMMIGALYLGVNSLLGITLSTSEKQSFAYLLPYSLGALVLWWAHWQIWHASRKLEMAETPMDEVKK